MLKKYLTALLIGGLFLLSPGTKSYAGDNKTMMQCLMLKDKSQIIGCLEENFPNLYKSYTGGITGAICEAENQPEDVRENCEKLKANWFNELLKKWQVLYSQCPQGTSAADCIKKIDIGACEQVEGIPPDLNKSTCYALGAFLKNDESICKNQFYNQFKWDCDDWLKTLFLDCPGCADSVAISPKRYFNWLDGTAASMKDISYCEKMNDTDKRNDCFSRAALGLRDKSLCDNISDSLKRDTCHSLCTFMQEHDSK